MPQYVYSTLKPKVDSFKVVEAKDVKFNDEKSVDERCHGRHCRQCLRGAAQGGQKTMMP